MSSILSAREVIIGPLPQSLIDAINENPLDATIEANAVVKQSMRLNLRRWLFRRAARRYGFYRAFCAAERGYQEACRESEERAQSEGLGEGVMRSGVIGDAKVTILFCIAALAAIWAVEGLR